MTTEKSIDDEETAGASSSCMSLSPRETSIDEEEEPAAESSSASSGGIKAPTDKHEEEVAAANKNNNKNNCFDFAAAIHLAGEESSIADETNDPNESSSTYAAKGGHKRGPSAGLLSSNVGNSARGVSAGHRRGSSLLSRLPSLASLVLEPEVVVDREELNHRVAARSRTSTFFLQQDIIAEGESEEGRPSIDHRKSSKIRFEEELSSSSAAAAGETPTTDEASKLVAKGASWNKIHVAFTHLFGEDYSSKESSFVIIAGGIIAWNVGFVQGACMSGFLNEEGQRQSVAGFTAGYTISAQSVATGDMEVFKNISLIIMSYIFGNFIAGIMTPNPTPYQLEPSYGPTFLIGGLFLFAASMLSMCHVDNVFTFCCAAAANGVVNGIASLYSANLIRVAITGATTDVGLILAQLVGSRGKNLKNFYKGLVLAMILSFFWLGCLCSYYAAEQLTENTLIFNAILYWMIGLALIYFLMHEIGLSFQAALFGHWKWKRAMSHMGASIIVQQRQRKRMKAEDAVLEAMLDGRSIGTAEKELDDTFDEEHQLTPSLMYNLFDEMIDDDDDEIDASELFQAVSKAGVTMKMKDVKILIKAADKDRNGTIDRDEWNDLVRKFFGKRA